MNKRQFLGAAAAGALPLAARATAASLPPPPDGPALLTVTGAIAHANRGPFDPVLDQMMHKHGVSFRKAYAFDDAALRALPAVTIRPTLEYDSKTHQLRGPLLLDLLAHAGASDAGTTVLVLRVVDGY